VGVKRARSAPSLRRRLLLDEVAGEDRGPQALRSHLTSDTGLVYTLLAHAAGRLD